MILEVCNPQEASRVLSGDLLAGYLLPAKSWCIKKMKQQNWYAKTNHVDQHDES